MQEEVTEAGVEGGYRVGRGRLRAGGGPCGSGRVGLAWIKPDPGCRLILPTLVMGEAGM